MLGMLKRHEVKILLKAGHRKAEVARPAGVSLRSVNRTAADRQIERGRGLPETSGKGRAETRLRGLSRNR
jgi:hypothetical protein